MRRLDDGDEDSNPPDVILQVIIERFDGREVSLLLEAQRYSTDRLKPAGVEDFGENDSYWTDGQFTDTFRINFFLHTLLAEAEVDVIDDKRLTMVREVIWTEGRTDHHQKPSPGTTD